MNTILHIFVVSIVPLALCQHYEEVPYCKNGGKALEEDVISHTINAMNKNVRYSLQKGNQLNGPTTNGPKFLPKAKKLDDVKWSCDMEQEAMKLLGDKCLETAPATPPGKTGLFFKFDGMEDLSYVTAISAWLEEIDKTPLSDAATSGAAVTYQGDPNTANFTS
ncbi:hypothetical protein Y032_0610g629 [Ancylostoma ceylanicum]|nr:hypothetical protein Y032_0610g629 [Ancylostoma ceylanicum]